MTEETPADRVAADLGHAAGRRLQIRAAREYIDDELALTRLEQFELALAILDDLNYQATLAWDRESSRDATDDTE